MSKHGQTNNAAALDGKPDQPSRNWYGDLNAKERNALWSCKIGYMLDAMDTQMLSFVIPTLISTWSISRADAGLIGTMTLLSSALGGWGAGILSDTIGRVKTLQLTVLWFATFTFLCGLAQNYEQLMVARTLMGLGFGGEWTAGAVLIGEIIKARDRGKAVGLVQAGWALGWGLSALLYALLFSLLPADEAWRALFMVGLVPAVFVVFVRRFVDEPQVFKDQQMLRAQSGESTHLFEIFGPNLRGITIRAAMLATGAQGGYYAITTWLPTFLKTERHLTVLGTGAYLAVVIVGSYIGYLVGAYLSDLLGRRINFILYALGSLIVVFSYTYLNIDNHTMLWLGFPLGFFASGVFSGMGAFLTELFPTRVRGSGQGFCYNFGRAIGALFPFLIGALSERIGLGQAVGIFAASAYTLMIIAALTLPETRGKELEAYAYR